MFLFFYLIGLVPEACKRNVRHVHTRGRTVMVHALSACQDVATSRHASVGSQREIAFHLVDTVLILKVVQLNNYLPHL